MKRALFLLAILTLFTSGCAIRYKVNEPLTQFNPDKGYRGKNMGVPGSSSEVLLYLTFSGGGTRAAAFSYGVLEELKKTEVSIGGQKRRLLDEIDAISAVSGGSFTAGYYGLFGERIFEDFEKRFLKKDVQGSLTRRILLNPVNWVRMFSPYYDRSDLAAEYYDKYIFDGGTFGDIAARKGPMILINATDMVTGIRLSFFQDTFDVICSDLSVYPVARAAAASSAVPVLLTPITLRNYSGSCGFELPEHLKRALEGQETESRQYHHVSNVKPYLDTKKNRYIHLVDGGVADNLGLRAALDRVLALGNVWNTLKYGKHANVHKVVFIVVNAETEVRRSLSLLEQLPAIGDMIDSYSSIAITRYNFETLMLLKESFRRWAEEVRTDRCAGGPVSTEPGGCGDIRFYLVEVKFGALKSEEERSYFKGLPTSFRLAPDEVDKLRATAGQVLRNSPEFQRFLSDLGR